MRLVLKGGGCENVGAQYSLPNEKLKANRDLDPKLEGASVRATLPRFAAPRGKPYGWLDPQAWMRFASYFTRNSDRSARPTMQDATIRPKRSRS